MQTVGAGDQTTDLLISGPPALPPEPQPQCYAITVQSVEGKAVCLPGHAEWRDEDLI